MKAADLVQLFSIQFSSLGRKYFNRKQWRCVQTAFSSCFRKRLTFHLCIHLVSHWPMLYAQNSSRGGDLISIHMMLIGWGKDGHIDGSYMQSFKCKTIYLFVKATGLNKYVAPYLHPLLRACNIINGRFLTGSSGFSKIFLIFNQQVYGQYVYYYICPIITLHFIYFLKRLFCIYVEV